MDKVTHTMGETIMDKFKVMTNEELTNVSGGKLRLGKAFGGLYTLVGEWPDMKKGWKQAVKNSRR